MPLDARSLGAQQGIMGSLLDWLARKATNPQPHPATQILPSFMTMGKDIGNSFYNMADRTKQALGGTMYGPESAGPMLRDTLNVTALGGAPTALAAGGKGALPAAAALRTFPEYKLEYPPIGDPVLMQKQSLAGISSGGYSKAGKAEPWPTKVTPKQAEKLVAEGKAFWQKTLSPEAKEFQKVRSQIQGDIDAGNYQPYFDVGQRYDANPKDFPPFEDTKSILRKKEETRKKFDALAFDPAAKAKLDDAFERGFKTKEQSGNWYMVGQLADEYKNVYGPKEGAKLFKERFADAMAATTGGADPTANFLMAHYGNFLVNKGRPTPPSYEMPFPIGGRYVTGNMAQFDKMIREGEGVTPANPKRYNFSGGFQGNPTANTIDEQMSSAWPDPSKPNKPMTMPPTGTYGHFQGALDQFAAEKGVDPRFYQEVAWAGLKDFPGKPMIQIINEAIERTARLTGSSPEEVVREALVKAARPMYQGGPGAFLSAAGMGQQR